MKSRSIGGILLNLALLVAVVGAAVGPIRNVSAAPRLESGAPSTCSSEKVDHYAFQAHALDPATPNPVSATTNVSTQTIFMQLCLNRVAEGGIDVCGLWWHANETIIWTVSQNPSGIVGFALTPDGPFSETLEVPVKLDANGNGTSTFYIKALRAGETTATVCSSVGCATQPGPYDITVVELHTVAFINDGQLDPNPNQGRGLRIYPDKTSPTDTADRRTVTVEATTSTPDALVYFRALDVDDPSTNDSPVDSNGPDGNDNRGIPQAGTLSATSAKTDANGVARETFTVSMHPGDNFRVVVGCSPGYLAGIVAVGTDLRDASGNILPTDGAKMSEMLTVWRRFHIELDTMAPIKGNVVTGTITKVSVTSSATTLTLSQMKQNGTSLTTLEDSGQKNRFINGRLTVDTLGGFPVAANTRNTVTVNAPIPNASAANGKTFTLVDDDDYNEDDGATLDGDEGESLVAPLAMSSVLQSAEAPDMNVFAPAYIMPVYDGGGDTAYNTHDIPFKLNIANTQSATLPQFTPVPAGDPGRNSAGNESDDYWVLYLQLAYQGDARADGDPGSEALGEGNSPAVSSTRRPALGDTATSEADVPVGAEGSLVYLETIREDKADGLVRTIPHEVGHQFGLKGDTAGFGLMSYSEPLQFVPQHLNVLRWRVKSPGQQ